MCRTGKAEVNSFCGVPFLWLGLQCQGLGWAETCCYGYPQHTIVFNTPVETVCVQGLPEQCPFDSKFGLPFVTQKGSPSILLALPSLSLCSICR